MKVTIIFFAIALCRMRHVTFDDGFGDGDVDVDVDVDVDIWVRLFPANVIPGGASVPVMRQRRRRIQSVPGLIEAVVFSNVLSHGDTETRRIRTEQVRL